MAIFEKNGKWYIDYYFGGKRIRECVGTSKKLAKQALEARKGEIALERFSLKKSEQRIRFDEFSKDYLEFSRSYKRSYKRDTQHVGHLLEHFSGKFLDEISPAFIEKYKQTHVQKVKPATVNRELACLRNMLNTAIRWKLLEKNPLDEVRPYQEILPPLRFLSSEEADRLIEQCSSWLKPIVITALHTGMRFREILNLEWRHTDLESGVSW